MGFQQQELVAPTVQQIGSSPSRMDALSKVTGRAMFCGDIILPGMLYCKIKRSPFARAKIVSVDLEGARQISGVKAIITGDDFPPPVTEDTPPLARGEVLYPLQAVVAVAATNSSIAKKAVESINVKYEKLPPIFDVESSLSATTTLPIRHPGDIEGEPNVGRHMKVRKGDFSAALATADVVIESTYKTAAVSHFQLERLTFVAQPDIDGGVTIWATSPSPSRTKYEVARHLGIDPSLVRVNIPFLGGWFGSKEEAHLAAICAKLSLVTSRPVRLELSREETIAASAVRHPSRILIKDGVLKGGKIIARKIVAVYDGGAYGSYGNTLVKGAVLAAVSVYDIPNVEIDCYRVYTNHVPGSAMRSPMAVQMAWAIESQMDKIASSMGIDPVTLRLRNLLHAGGENAIGEIMEGIDHETTLRKVVEAINIHRKRPDEGPWRTGRGVALAAKWGEGGPHQAIVTAKESGKIAVLVPAVENGQGALTVLAQIVANEFGIPLDQVEMRPLLSGTNSELNLVSSGASASRQTVNLGTALLEACTDLKNKLKREGALILGTTADELEVRGGKIFVRSNPSQSIGISDLFTSAKVAAGKLARISFVPAGELSGYGLSFKRLSDLDSETGKIIKGRASPYYVSAAQAVELSVNIETGQVRVHRIVAAMDVGKAINPELVRHQIIGSVMMGLSATLSEELVFSEGRIVNPNLADYKILTSIDTPEIQPIIVEVPYAEGPYGAKGGGEQSVLPTAPAVRNAIHDAVGVWIDELPITPEAVLTALDRDGRRRAR